MHIGKKDRDDEGERKTLEEEVDAMMDPKRPDGPARRDEAPDGPPAEQAKPKVSAVSAPTGPASTAPTLSEDLRKKIGISDADTKPLSIDKLDEITDRISASEKDPKEDPQEDGPEERKPRTGPQAPPKDLDEGSADLDDARTEEAVDDIVSHEGDVMLAVEDATRKERNPELKTPKTVKKKGGHRVLATILWTLVLFVAIVAVLFVVLLVTGGDVTAK